jgi:Flp pilus assembly protein TadB
MAQTKRKRRTKHRGNAAGVVETRGRTGRKPTEDERKKDARTKRAERFDRPPSWKSAANRAALATILFIVAVAVLFKQSLGAALGIGGFMFLMYIPLGYYTDQFIYRRRQAKKAQGTAPPRKP